MPQTLHTRISTVLWEALLERSRTSGQTVGHIVQAALAEALDITHQALFQVSTSGAIVQGLYQGCVSVAELRRHGDVGLGTFENLDGEMILLDGHCFQARADGTVAEAPDHALTPFATVVHFAPDDELGLEDVSLMTLSRVLDTRRASRNTIESFRITGLFRTVDLRAACPSPSGVDLVTATTHQALFHHQQIEGTLVGFWSPEYQKSIGITGYHLHFLSSDRRHGGHVLEFEAEQLHVEINEISQVVLALPETDAFRAADLDGDHAADLDRAEHSRSGS